MKDTSEGITVTTIGILGGSGEAGHIIAKLLLKREDTHVILMGRSETKLANACTHLGSTRVETRVVDSQDLEALRTAMLDLDLIIVAAPVLNRVAEIAQVALETSTSWLDILVDTPEKTEVLTALGQEFSKAGLSLIASSGLHPGLPGAMVRALGDTLESPKGTQVALRFGVNWKKYNPTKETEEEFTIEMNRFTSAAWVGGQYKTYRITSPNALRRVDFGSPFGVKDCSVMELEEIRRLPEFLPTLEDAGLAMSGFSFIVDYVFLPLAWGLMKLGRTAAATRLMWHGLRNYTHPPYGVVLIADLWDSGEDMVRLTVAHEDGYWLTAAVAAATTYQYLDGPLAKPGYHQAGLAVDPPTIFADLEQMGARVKNFSGKQQYGLS